MSQVGTAPHEKTAEQLLRAREAQGLVWSISARLAFYAVLIVVSHVLPTRAVVFIVALCLVGGSGSIYSLVLARRQVHLRFVGLAGVGLDLLFLGLLPINWYLVFGESDLPRSFLLETHLEVASLLFIAINTLALRPLYPAVVTGGAILLHLSILGFVLSDPRVVLTQDVVHSLSVAAVGLQEIVFPIIGIMVAGVFLTFVARAARRTVYDVGGARSGESAHRQRAGTARDGREDGRACQLGGGRRTRDQHTSRCDDKLGGDLGSVRLQDRRLTRGESRSSSRPRSS